MPVSLGLLALLLAAGCAEPPPDGPRAHAVPPDTLVLSDGSSVALSTDVQARLIAEDSLWATALHLHYDALVMDGHIDTPSLMLEEGYRFGERHTPEPGRAHVDLPRMVEGGLDAAFFSIYVSRHYGEGPEATARARAMIAEVERQVDALDSLPPTRSGGAAIAYSSDDVLRLTRDGRKAILFGLEGGHALQASDSVLADLHAAGIRYVTLTHTNTNSWADSSQDVARHDGLTEEGVALVRAMNDLGVLVDLSHVSDATFYDALRASRAPVIASHSSARALVDNPRNVDDAMLRALADNGGVLLVNFYDPLVNGALDADAMAAVRTRLARDHGGDSMQLWAAIRAEARARGLRRATLDDVLDHIEHAARLVGPEHVGLGSDFDGVSELPEGLEDVTRLPWLTYGLLKRGFSENEVRLILGGNLLRALRAAEQEATGH